MGGLMIKPNNDVVQNRREYRPHSLHFRQCPLELVRNDENLHYQRYGELGDRLTGLITKRLTTRRTKLLYQGHTTAVPSPNST